MKPRALHLLLFLAVLHPSAFAKSRKKLDAWQFHVDGIRLGEPYAESSLGASTNQDPAWPLTFPPDGRILVMFNRDGFNRGKGPRSEDMKGSSIHVTVHWRDNGAFGHREIDHDMWKQNPVLAVAWVAGTYMDTHSDFPLHVGEPAARATALLGRPLRRAEVGAAYKNPNRRLIASFYPGDIVTLTDDDVLVGFVLGRVRPEMRLDEWAFLATQWRHTLPRSTGL